MSTQDDKGVEISLTADPSLRRGVYVNVASVRTTAKEAIVDFGFIDSEEQQGDGRITRSGCLQSRIVMSLDTLVELRDTLDSHIESNLVKVEAHAD